MDSPWIPLISCDMIPLLSINVRVVLLSWKKEKQNPILENDYH